MQFGKKELHPVYLYHDKFFFEVGDITDETKNSSQKERVYLLNLKKDYTSKGAIFLKGDNWSELTKIGSN